MTNANDVLPVNSLIGRSVLSLASGNKLGSVRDSFIDPLNGVLVGLWVTNSDGALAALQYEKIHNFGHDAIMAVDDSAIQVVEGEPFAGRPNSKELIGTKLITESGKLMGHIADIFVTSGTPPLVFYEIRDSLLDRLLGRQMFIPAFAGNALSDDRERLVVPDETSQIASSTIASLVEAQASVASVSPGRGGSSRDDTVVVPIEDRGDDTVVRLRDEDETVVQTRDDDETVLRWRPRAR